MYRLIDNITGRTSEKPMPENISDETLVNDFANFFMDKIQKINNALQQYDKYIPSRNTNANILSCFREMMEDEVIKIIGEMSPKSCELDAIPSSLLKWLVTDLAPTMTKLVNTSLTTGRFASNWKTLIIRPLLKKLRLELLLANYRPVSNLSFISKLVEKCVLKQFIQHCDDQNLIPVYQSAYRSRYSTEMALVKITNNILWSFEKQNASALIVMDLSATFDMVDHQILLDVLENRYGITGTALSWFRTYLPPRFCKVCINKSYSKLHDLTFSIPQGSCAGPVTYLVYASTMEDITPPHICLHGYVDDHGIKNKFDASNRMDETNMINSLVSTTDDIKIWMDKKHLKMNGAKREFITFAARKQLPKCETTEITVDNCVIQRESVICYLGAWLDQHLSLKKHITTKCATAMFNIQCIKHIQNTLTQSTCQTLVQGLVMAHLDYANALYFGLPDIDVKKLQRVQNMAARLILRKTNSDSITECFRE